MIKIILNKLQSSWNNDESGFVFFINPYSYLKLRENPKLLNSATRVYFDGNMLCKLFQIFKLKKVKRFSFDYTSIADDIFKNAVSKKKKVAIVGSTKEACENFVKLIQDKYTNINIIYHRDGYFINKEDKKETIGKLMASDVVICGMGTPIQESLLSELNFLNYSGMAFTCGGFIHQTASSGYQYYPEWADKLNLRFIYRMYDEPKLIRRYFIDYPHFLVVFLYDYLRYKKNK
jgi:N-acetylglucosaminyldiphosphoundecaprenol N-acetyl-beta-D-mannosaminyltransferase